MATPDHLDQPPRQVLVNIGNRYVVFGDTVTLPQRPYFDPDKVSELLPRVADESEFARDRIIQTLRVSGMETAPTPTSESDGDVVLLDKDGKRTIVEIKTRSSDPKPRDYTQAFELIRSHKSEPFEVWFFLIERLKLLILRMVNGLPDTKEMPPLDVWEKTESGIFDRSHVISEVEIWADRVNALFRTIEEWLDDHESLRFDRTRTVTMSEELMQKFAVTDRDLPILDVLRGDEVVASFVPRGLWLIGAWGRVDVITKNSTSAIIGIRSNPMDDSTFHWCLSLLDRRRELKPFTQEALLAIVAPR